MLVYVVALANILAQLYFTDYFLNYQFLRSIHNIYCPPNLSSYSYPRDVFYQGAAHQDRVFPKQAKCSLYR